MSTREQRRARHPEVDWRQPITFMEHESPDNPRNRAKPRFDAPPCICGCVTTAHDMDTGECRRCGCEWLQVVAS